MDSTKRKFSRENLPKPEPRIRWTPGVMCGSFEAHDSLRLLLPKGVSISTVEIFLEDIHLQNSEESEAQLTIGYAPVSRSVQNNSVLKVREGYQTLDLNTPPAQDTLRLSVNANFVGRVWYSLMYRIG